MAWLRTSSTGLFSFNVVTFPGVLFSLRARLPTRTWCIKRACRGELQYPIKIVMRNFLFFRRAIGVRWSVGARARARPVYIIPNWNLFNREVGTDTQRTRCKLGSVWYCRITVVYNSGSRSGRFSNLIDYVSQTCIHTTNGFLKRVNC